MLLIKPCGWTTKSVTALLGVGCLLGLANSGLQAAGVPHYITGITVDTNGLVSVQLGGSVSNLFPLPGAAVGQYLQMFDLAYRSLARAGLGRTAEALTDLAAVEQSLPKFPSPPALSPILFEPDLVAAQLLYDEAKRLLTMPSSSPKP